MLSRSRVTGDDLDTGVEFFEIPTLAELEAPIQAPNAESIQHDRDLTPLTSLPSEFDPDIIDLPTPATHIRPHLNPNHKADEHQDWNDPANADYGRGMRRAHAAWFALDDPEPDTFKQAIASPESAEWRKAMDEEFTQLNNTHTYDLIDPPPGANIIGNRWIFFASVMPPTGSPDTRHVL
jgi:hypothetical protein